MFFTIITASKNLSTTTFNPMLIPCLNQATNNKIDFTHNKNLTYFSTSTVKEIKTNLEKNQCLGVTIKGFQCKRQILQAYCFQHNKQITLNGDTRHIVPKQLDQFFTNKNNATVCMQIYKSAITISKEKDVIIEPSAGCGSFISMITKLCDNTIFIDIDPKHNSIQIKDFLKFDSILSKFERVHVIGNPPFSIVTKFIKKASKIADYIGFILPLSFRKESRKKVFPLNFHCVYQHILLDTAFYFNNKLHKVPTIFQIWEKKHYDRNLPIKIVSKYVQFVRKKDSPTLSFRRVGSQAGEISDLIANKSENSHYFIKLIGGLSKIKFYAVYKKIKFYHQNTVAQKSISQQELLLELYKNGL